MLGTSFHRFVGRIFRGGISLLSRNTVNMKAGKVARFVVLIAAVFFIWGCNKKVDESFPEVSFLGPAVGSTYFLPDTVFVTVQVKDDLNLDYVKISVTKEAGIPVSSVFLENELPGIESTVSCAIICEDVHLETGTYFVQVSVSDGTNVREAFREINLVEVPKQLKATLLFSNQGNATKIDSLSSEGQVIALATVPHSMSFGLAGSYHQEVLIAGTSASGISLLRTDNWVVHGNVPIIGSQVSDFVRDISFQPSRKRYYASCFDGRIRSFSRKGNNYGEYFISQNFVPEIARLIGDKLYVFAHNQSASMKTVFVFNVLTGVLIQSAQVNWNIRGFFPLNNNELLLFGDNGSQWRALRMELEFLNINPLGSVEAPGVLRETLHMGGNRFAIRTQNAVFVINGFQSSAQQVQTSGTVKRIRFNDVTQRLMVLSGGQLLTVDLNGSVLLAQTVGNGVYDFDLLFNK
jgi:hypothetical protein